jgi:hypothetical protein
MLYSFSLNRDNISCDKVCKEVQNLIHKYKQHNEDLSNALIVIEIKSITDSPTNFQTPLIEYKG